jgi:O-antigen/teichoic acid export membrane protein
MLMGSAFGNIDSIVLRAFAGIETVGVYQSGMRIFQGGAQAAPILANVFLPAMAKQAQTKEKHPHAASLLQAAFLGFGAIFGLALAYFSAPIVTLAFGSGYTRLIALMPLFGLLFFIRFFASAWGLMLTAAGQQAFRAKATAIHLLFLLALGLYLTGRLHAEGWLIALILANVLLGMLYMGRAMLFNLGGSITLSAVLTCTVILFFIPRLI